jgi:hypothetical protein
MAVGKCKSKDRTKTLSPRSALSHRQFDRYISKVGKYRCVNYAAADERANEELVTDSGTTTELARCITAVVPWPTRRQKDRRASQRVRQRCRYSRRPQ